MNPSTPDFSDADAAFARFCQRADPNDLAFVFDRLASRLLLVAAHVTPDPTAAEDLVQETFVDALESAGSFELGRPVLPWLTTILRRRAIDRMRREQVRHGASLDEIQLVSDATSPMQAAEDAEVLERVERALAEMDSPYRETLALRVVHGLSPTEIAHALNRKPGTVRMQLKRGLEELRTKLPLAISSALVLAILPERGLAAVRARVLGVATRGVKPVVLLGLSRMAWIAIAAVLVVLVSAPLVWSSLEGGGKDQDPESTSSLVSGKSAEVPGSQAPSDTSRESVLAAAASKVTRILGRCLSAETRAAVAGAKVTLKFSAGRFVQDDAQQWPEPITVQSAVDGHFVVEFVARPEMRVSLAIAGPGLAPVNTSWASLRNEIDVELGDILLPPGGTVSARVVDESGVPVSGVLLELKRRSGGVERDLDASFGLVSSYEFESGLDGVLPIEKNLLVGTYGIEVSFMRRAYEVVQPLEFVVASGVATIPMDIVIKRPAAEESLSGRVVDENGLVVTDLVLSIHPQIDSWSSLPTASDGTFWLPALPGPKCKLFLHVDCYQYVLDQPDLVYERGATQVLVRVTRQSVRDLTIRVTNATTGKPVQSFGTRWSVDYWVEERSLMVPPMGSYRPMPVSTHMDGELVLKDVFPGRYSLSVFPENEALASCRLLPIVIEDGGESVIEVALQPYAPLRVRVHDAEGEPIAGAEVQLIHGMGSHGNWAAMFTREQVARGVGGGRTMVIILDTQSSDADGWITFRAPVGDDRVYLVLAAKGVERRTLGPYEVSVEGAEFVIETERTAQISGVLGPMALLDLCGPSKQGRIAAESVRPEDAECRLYDLQIVLDPIGDTSAGSAYVHPLLDGRFDLPRVPPGDYRVRLVISWPMNPGFYTSDDHVIGELLGVKAGERRGIELDASALLPATMRGKIRLNGVEWTAGRVGLLAVGDEDHAFFQIRVGAEGRFEFVVSAGSYLPYLNWTDREGKDRYLYASERVEFMAGQVVDTNLWFEQRGLLIQLEGIEPGEKVDSVWISAIDYPEIRPWTARRLSADARGLITLPAAPPGRLRVSLGDKAASARELGILQTEPGVKQSSCSLSVK